MINHYGLIANATILRNIEKGQLITFDGIKIPESLALKAWKETIQKNISRNLFQIIYMELW